MGLIKAAMRYFVVIPNDETPGLRPAKGRKYGGQSRRSLPHRQLEYKFILEVVLGDGRWSRAS